MEMLKYKNIYCTYLKQGNTKNGNPIYILNFFKLVDDEYININHKFKEQKDSKNNVKVSSYNIDQHIEFLVNIFEYNLK